MKLIFFLLSLLTLSNNAKDNLDHKYISDDYYKYDFFISDDLLKKHNNYKEYFWYKAGKIQHTVAGSNGKVLDGIYKKSYHSNQIAAIGYFNRGLKNNKWKHWHENGQLKEIIAWNNGIKDGYYKSFNTKGELELVGKYKNNLKHGKWILITEKDTLRYKKGVLIQQKIKKVKTPPETKTGIFLAKTSSKTKVFFKKTGNNIKHFFKKLFSKKESTSETKKTKNKKTTKTVKSNAKK